VGAACVPAAVAMTCYAAPRARRWAPLRQATGTAIVLSSSTERGRIVGNRNADRVRGRLHKLVDTTGGYAVLGHYAPRRFRHEIRSHINDGALRP
jgi:hypothetical protein